jgi:hypothetical protein
MIRASLRGSVGHLLSRVVVHLPPALGLRAKVQQQPNLEISGFEVVEQLSVVLSQERFQRLDLHNDKVVEYQVGHVLSDDNAFEFDPDRILLDDGEASLRAATAMEFS